MRPCPKRVTPGQADDNLRPVTELLAASISPRATDTESGRAWGRSLRREVPRSSHAECDPPLTRSDPIALLEAANEVNGFKKLVAEKNAPVPAAPAAG